MTVRLFVAFVDSINLQLIWIVTCLQVKSIVKWIQQVALQDHIGGLFLLFSHKTLNKVKTPSMTAWSFWKYFNKVHTAFQYLLLYFIVINWKVWKGTKFPSSPKVFCHSCAEHRKLKGLVQLNPRLYSGWRFLTSQWYRQLKLSANAGFRIFETSQNFRSFRQLFS